ncbi:short-chain fatty acid transporter [Corynebacterium sp.]|uniref:short-chain fatty acid transporter n=1 Tax=Corynebacterium sp. TaxID=1720 RepID=UPI0026E045E2|nr:TIGR00366 family protein [Corynebacterium sp.]
MVNFTTRVVQRYMPDAFILAIFLTVLVSGAALIFTPSTPLDVVNSWGTGFSELFTFAMQMALVLLTGYILALSPIVTKLLDKLTDIPKTPRQGYLMTAAISFFACYLNWGMGLVVGALLARAIGRKIPGIHFPLVVAAAYSAEIVRGPSSSIPAVMATPDHFMFEETGLIPVSETLYSPWNLAITAVILVALLVFYASVRVPKENIISFTGPEADDVGETVDRSSMTPAEKLDHSRILLLLLAILPGTYLVSHFATNGFDINLNTVILLFLTLALVAHRNVVELLAAVEEAITSTRGIILQFPLYAGVAGIMATSGLVDVISDWIIGVATQETFPVLTFLSAGVVNFFIPSGGGQWAVQGPVTMAAAEAIGADIPQTLMAFAWGDAWTNQVQPFWALPLLGVAGLSARDIMGYCMIWLLVTGVIIAGAFTLLAMF